MDEKVDRQLMHRCIEISKQSYEAGDAPFGSLVAIGDKIIAEGLNNKEVKVSDHAEILAMHNAHQALGTIDLTGCTLYTSCEPCPMCSFMAREYKVSRIVFALRSPHMGGHSKWPILSDANLTKIGSYFGPPPEVLPGFMENEAMAVMSLTPLAKYFKR